MLDRIPHVNAPETASKLMDAPLRDQPVLRSGGHRRAMTIEIDTLPSPVLGSQLAEVAAAGRDQEVAAQIGEGAEAQMQAEPSRGGRGARSGRCDWHQRLQYGRDHDQRGPAGQRRGEGPPEEDRYSYQDGRRILHMVDRATKVEVNRPDHAQYFEYEPKPGSIVIDRTVTFRDKEGQAHTGLSYVQPRDKAQVAQVVQEAIEVYEAGASVDRVKLHRVSAKSVLIGINILVFVLIAVGVSWKRRPHPRAQP